MSETTTEQLAEIEGQSEPIQVREGRWRTRGGEIRNVTPTPEHDGRTPQYPWWDAQYKQAWTAGGKHYAPGNSTLDLVLYLGPIKQPEKIITPDDLAGQALAGAWDQAKPERTIEELRSEVHYVQRLLGESRQRVTQLEELVASLRTINEATEKTVRAAGQQNTDLQHRLEVVSKEWAEQLETVRKLQIELDAAQQVPQAVSDRFEEGWDAGTSQAVETIAEWTEPFRTCGSERLALAVMANLPHIMRTLTGLTPED